MTTRGIWLLLLAVVLGLTVAADAFQPLPANAQGNVGTVTVVRGQDDVYEGAEAVFIVTRSGGPMNQAVTVRLQSWEPNHLIGFGVNPSSDIHHVTLEPQQTTATLSVLAYVDGVSESYDVLEVHITNVGSGYETGNPDRDDVTIGDPPSGTPVIGISSNSSTVAEGGNAGFTITRSGDTSSNLTVDLTYDDPHGLLRGNHWDPPPSLPTDVTMPAGTGSFNLTLPVPDDLRDAGGQSLTLSVEPSSAYLLGNIGLETKADVTVTDNDTAQQLELRFGKDGVNDTDVNEGDTLKFVAKRRQQDARRGNAARFVVRVETDRSGRDGLLEDWTEDASLGRLFKEYPLELAGSDTEIAQELEVIENGAQEGDWSYWAYIKKLEDVDGNHLTVAQEAEYWTVKQGFRETTVDAADSGGNTGTVSLGTTQTEVYEGEAVHFTLTREGGPMGEEREVKVTVREPNRSQSITTSYYATFEPWQTTATLSILAYIDRVDEEDDPDIFEAVLEDVGEGYESGTPDPIVLDINDPPGDIPLIHLSAFSLSSSATVDEGDDLKFTLRRTQDTSSDVTVQLRYSDRYELLRGNHWDPPPVIPTSVNIPAGQTRVDVNLPIPDDQRIAPIRNQFFMEVIPSKDYLLGGSGLGDVLTVWVNNDDTAQELQLWWGDVGDDESAWEAGQAWRTCVAGSCTPGPAEGTFYYEDDRAFNHTDQLKEGRPVHFGVTRRAEDVGQTATFVIRVEHNRGWESPRHAHWPIDPVTGNHYFEFPLTLTGNQRQVVRRIELLNNGSPDPSWVYSAEIKRIEDVAKGTVLDSAAEAAYWTVNEQGNQLRRNVVQPEDRGWPFVFLTDATPDPVTEGGQVTFTLERYGGNSLEPLDVQMRTWEPNVLGFHGVNPSEQIHTITFPAVPMTSQWVESPEQVVEVTLAVTDDAVFEGQHFLKAELLDNGSQGAIAVERRQVEIVDDDDVGVTVAPAAITVVGGRSNDYSLALDTEPWGDVTVTIDGAAGPDLLLNNRSLTFTPSNWNVAQTVRVTAVQGAAASTETLTHTVSSAGDPYYDGETVEDVIVTVIEAPEGSLLQVGATVPDQDLTVAEGESDAYSIVLSSQPSGDVTVDIGGATGTDLSLDQTTLTFTGQDWDVPQEVTVTAGQDADVIDDTITLTHTVTSVNDANYQGLNAGNVAVTVTDDDLPSVAVSFEQGTYTVAEGDEVSVRVILSADPERPVEIPLTMLKQGGATNFDYYISPPNLTFNTGETEKDFTFTATQDTDNDDGESVKVGLGDTLPAGMFEGSVNEAVVSIEDDDGPPVTASFEYARYSVLEGTSVIVTVVLDVDPELEVTVPLTAAPRSGATSDDYSGVPPSLTFNSGVTEQELRLHGRSGHGGR